MTLTVIASTVSLDLDALALLVAAKLTPAAPPVVVVPPPPVASPGDVYVGGKFLWPGDWSSVMKVNYTDSDLAGLPCMSITTAAAWGEWLPYAPGQDLNIAPYTALQFDIQPLTSGQKWQIYFEKVGDLPVGVALDPSKYAAIPASVWTTVKMPLKDFGILGVDILKFAFQDQTGKVGVRTNLRNVRFV